MRIREIAIISALTALASRRETAQSPHTGGVQSRSWSNRDCGSNHASGYLCWFPAWFNALMVAKGAFNELNSIAD
jgi:hypothetical protein